MLPTFSFYPYKSGKSEENERSCAESNSRQLHHTDNLSKLESTSSLSLFPTFLRLRRTLFLGTTRSEQLAIRHVEPSSSVFLFSVQTGFLLLERREEGKKKGHFFQNSEFIDRTVNKF
eukprot:g81602.t1